MSRGTRFHLPDPLALLFLAAVLAAVLTWILPAGEYDRVPDAESGRNVVVPGSFDRVEPDPVGPFEAFVALPRGMTDAGEIIFLVFLVGGAFTVVDRAGALRWGLGRLTSSLGRREMLVVPFTCLIFALGGLLFNMAEEIIAMAPVLLLVARRLRLDPVVAVAMSMGAAAVGASFSPINPFQVGIAQGIAELQLLSGAGFRSVFLVLAVGLWTLGVTRYARRTRLTAGRGLEPSGSPDIPPDARPGGAPEGTQSGREALVLLIVGVTFAVYITGVLRLDWGFNEMSGLFALMGILAGLLGRLGVDGTARAYAAGFRDMALAAILIGVARAIYLVLADGRVVDTIVHGLLQPIEGLPPAAAAVGMEAVHAIIHIPVPSQTGQAVLTLPILVPLSDLLGLARQITVLAYQYGSGLCDLVTPTNGALMAMLVASGVSYERWIRLALPLWTSLMGLGAVSILVASLIGLG